MIHCIHANTDNIIVNKSISSLFKNPTLIFIGEMASISSQIILDFFSTTCTQIFLECSNFISIKRSTRFFSLVFFVIQKNSDPTYVLKGSYVKMTAWNIEHNFWVRNIQHHLYKQLINIHWGDSSLAHVQQNVEKQPCFILLLVLFSP